MSYTPGALTASFHSRHKLTFEDAVRAALRRGERVYGNIQKSFLEKLQREVAAELAAEKKTETNVVAK